MCNIIADFYVSHPEGERCNRVITIEIVVAALIDLKVDGLPARRRLSKVTSDFLIKNIIMLDSKIFNY